MKHEFKVAKATCHTCDVEIGPSLPDNVAYELIKDHEGHDVEHENWTKEEIVECTCCDAEATHYEDITGSDGMGLELAFCDDCGWRDAQ